MKGSTVCLTGKKWILNEPNFFRLLKTYPCISHVIQFTLVHHHDSAQPLTNGDRTGWHEHTMNIGPSVPMPGHTFNCL